MKDYYAILGLNESADSDAIKKAYRERARKYHPDLNPGDASAEERFKEVSEAYAVLSDEERRRKYDEMRRLGVGGGGSAGGFRVDLDDLFGPGGAESLFEQLFGNLGGFGGRAPRRRRGQDLETTVALPFREAMIGGMRSLRLAVPEVCSACGGESSVGATCGNCGGSGLVGESRGSLRLQQTCPACGGRGSLPGPACDTCGGRGWQTVQREIKVRIPPGVASGQRLRLAGKGAPGREGGPPGDLQIRIEVTPDPQLLRDGDDIRLRLPIRPSEAAAGAQVSVPTLDGTSELRVPSGAQSGQKLRMRGKGVPRADGSRGDQLVELLIKLPPLDEANIEALRRWEDGFDPRS